MSSAGPPPPYPDHQEPRGQNPHLPPKPAYTLGSNHPTITSQGYNQPGQLTGGVAQPVALGYAQPAAAGAAQPSGMQANYNSETSVVMIQPAVTVIQTFRDVPVHTHCPHCRVQIVTVTHFESGTLTWLICFGLCVVLCCLGIPLGCCLIPFCIDGCQDAIHTCPNCRQQIARFGRL